MQFTKENAEALVAEYIESYSDDHARQDAKETINEFLGIVAARDMFAKPRKPGSGRKDGLTKKKIAEILGVIEANGQDAQGLSYAYLQRMVEAGYLEKKNVWLGKRGRPPVEYLITGKGRGLMNLARNWK